MICGIAEEFVGFVEIFVRCDAGFGCAFEVEG